MPDASAAARRAALLAEEIVKGLTAQGKMIALAESCTAGLASDFLARVPGASLVLWGSFVSYTAHAKTEMLGVPQELIGKYGAVSREVALAMAEGALNKSGASWAFSVTGLAGPGGDTSEGSAEISEETPIGTVWIGVAGQTPDRPQSEAKRFYFSGSRNEVRNAAALAVLEEVMEKL